MSVDLPRETALKILYDINENGAYSNISVNKHLEAVELNSLDKAFITDMVYGTIKWKLTIDWLISQYSSIKIKKISPWILNILRLGVYQIIYTDKIPQSAACNESVKLSKKYGHAASSGFVNAVLRSIGRNKQNINYPDCVKDQISYLSIKYSHPEWIVEKWVNRFGREFTEALLDSNNKVPDFTIRTNTLKTTGSQLIEILSNEGIFAAHGKYIENALIIENPASIFKSSAFKDGLFQVQDESSMQVSKVLDPRPGDFIIDVCSAPGGKATHIAELMQNNGTVLARDIHEHKINIINNAAKRLELGIIRAEMFDAAKLDEKYIEKADRVLVDAPCTGLGIIRRKPDIKWSRGDRDAKEIMAVQRKIINTASKYVKPGGILVYSTCTLEPEENEEMVNTFLLENPDFQSVDFSGLLPDGLNKDDAKKGYIQLYPNIDGIDGFFISKLRKVGK